MLSPPEKRPTQMIYAGGHTRKILSRDSYKFAVGTVHNIWQKFEVTGDISKKIPAEREIIG